MILGSSQYIKTSEKIDLWNAAEIVPEKTWREDKKKNDVQVGWDG
jgi:hypothetical protein